MPRLFFPPGEKLPDFRHFFPPGERIREGEESACEGIHICLVSSPGGKNCLISHFIPPEVNSDWQALIIECQLFPPPDFSPGGKNQPKKFHSNHANHGNRLLGLGVGLGYFSWGKIPARHFFLPLDKFSPSRLFLPPWEVIA